MIDTSEKAITCDVTFNSFHHQTVGREAPGRNSTKLYCCEYGTANIIAQLLTFRTGMSDVICHVIKFSGTPI